MPRPNQYLLLYVLDLLSVFARKAEKNLMTATSTSSTPPFLFLVLFILFAPAAQVTSYARSLYSDCFNRVRHNTS